MKPLAGRAFTYTAVAFLTASFAAGHGFFTKPCYNAEESLAGKWFNEKTNATVRGSVTGGEANQLYMMDPQLNRTGSRMVGGYRATFQDEEASTPEFVDFSLVRYDVDGVHPLEGAAGQIMKSTYAIFGVFSGQVSYDFTFTIGIPVTMTELHAGIGVLLPANAGWPADGASVHGQLNLPNDPLRPRVTAPFNKETWAFERPTSFPEVRPLGGRTLDTLQLMTVWATDPILKSYIVSDAYGNGKEMLFGPESMHPVASRGDEIGFYLQGGNDGEAGTAYFMLSPNLSPTPFQYTPASGNNFIYLDFSGGGAWPVLLMTGNPNPQHGRLTTPSIPYAWFPSYARDFWVQVLIHYPTSGLIRVTDVIGIKGA